MAYIKVPLNTIFNVERIISIHRLSLDKNYIYDGERHDFWEIIFVEKGRIDIHYDDIPCEMKEGEVFFHKPNEFHDVICDGVVGADIFILSFDCRSATMDYFNETKITLSDDLKRRMYDMISEAERTFEISTNPLRLKKNAPIGAAQMLRCHLETLFISIMREREKDDGESRILYSSRTELEEKLTKDVIEYLKENKRKCLSLDEICAHFHFGKSHICHIFKSQTGIGVKQYLLDLKIEEAKRLLTSSPLNVSEISDLLSFENPQYFAKIFKKKTGVSPSKYRKA